MVNFFFFFFPFFLFFSIFPRMERSEKNKINHLSIVFSGMSSVSLGWGVREVGRGSGEKLKPSPSSHFQILWFPSPRRWQKGTVGMAGREHGEREPQVAKGLLLLGPGRCQSPPWGPQGLLVGCIVGFRGSRRRLWVGTRAAAY